MAKPKKVSAKGLSDPKRTKGGGKKNIDPISGVGTMRDSYARGKKK